MGDSRGREGGQDHNNVYNIAMSWTPEGRRRKGRPKTAWRRTVEKEGNEGGWQSWKEVRAAVTDNEG